MGSKSIAWAIDSEASDTLCYTVLKGAARCDMVLHGATRCLRVLHGVT